MPLAAPLADDADAERAVEAFLAGVAAADPTVLVRQAVRRGLLDDWLFDLENPRWIQVLALGKGAPRMVWGLVEAGVPFRGIGVAPRGVPFPGVDTFTWHAGDHPVPGAQSFAAGREVGHWVDRMARDEPLLVLLSGGASACVETPEPPLSEEDLSCWWEGVLRRALDIGSLNELRAARSSLKGGKLGRRALERTSRIRVWLLADTPSEKAAKQVASAPFYQADDPPRIPHSVLASASDLEGAASRHLQAAGVPTYRFPVRIEGNLEAAVAAFVAAHAALPPGAALVGAGEANLAVPAGAPAGGRALHSALLASRGLRAGALFFAGASDGVDGTSGLTGGWSRPADWGPEAKRALAAFDAASFLSRRRQTMSLGATGTNVNDLWVALG
ncbi:MAG: DUF4147 domain-containing protein [Thermoplasmatota archaeon]